MKPLIVLHLFYPEMWEEFNGYFKKLDVEFDLMVSITEENKNFSDKIKEIYPNSKIFVLPNKGLDIGPFLQILKYLKENDLEYSHIVKLHTKKSHYNVNLGTVWRNSLVKCLIGSPEIFKTNLETINNSSIYKMCGSKSWLLKTNNIPHKKTLDILNIKKQISSFIGGTMFISDYKTILNSFSIEQIDLLYEKMPNGYVRDFSIAHDMERVFGFIIEENGYQIKGV